MDTVYGGVEPKINRLTQAEVFWVEPSRLDAQDDFATDCVDGRCEHSILVDVERIEPQLLRLQAVYVGASQVAASIQMVWRLGPDTSPGQVINQE